MKAILKITLLLLVVNCFQSCSKEDAPPPEPIAQPEPEIENQAPTINAQTFEAAENIADNMPIGTVVASDPDGDALTFSISTNDGALFEISESGDLSLDDLQTLDFETAESHTITVTVNDGTTSTEATVIITVIDIDDTSFVTTWETATSNETVTIQTQAAQFSYNYTIDWGDGTTQTGRTDNAMHTYTTAGLYTVRISGKFPAIVLNNNANPSGEQFRTVEQWGNIQWLSMFAAFIGVNTLTINATDVPDLSQVTSMQFMFAFIENFSGDLNAWDVSNVSNMETMFAASSFNGDISDWNVSNVTNMKGMFFESSFNQDISGWNVSYVTDMENMFRDSSFNKDISDWNVSNVTNCSLFASGAPLTPVNTPNFTNCTP